MDALAIFVVIDQYVFPAGTIGLGAYVAARSFQKIRRQLESELHGRGRLHPIQALHRRGLDVPPDAEVILHPDRREYRVTCPDGREFRVPIDVLDDDRVRRTPAGDRPPSAARTPPRSPPPRPTPAPACERGACDSCGAAWTPEPRCPYCRTWRAA